MTITVTAPNGATVQFPDGTDHETINSVMTQNFHPDAPAAAPEQPPAPVTTNDVVRSAATGVPVIGGLLNKADAATNAVLAPYLNGFFDKKDQLNEPTFSERYAHSLKDQEGSDATFEKDHPVIDAGAKIAGGVASMLPAAAAAPALLGSEAGLGTAIGANAALGGADAATRGGSITAGALTGAALPAAFAGAGKIGGAVANRVAGLVQANRDPEAFAATQFARAIHDSGQSAEDIAQRVQDANAAGQPLTPADAMGPAGQKTLAAVARGPGEGAQRVSDFLNARQAGQGDRVADIIDEGLGTGANGTARQRMAELKTQAQQESSPLYQDALNQQPVWSDRMQQFFDDPVTRQGLREGVGVQRLESLATGRPFNPMDHAITDFDEAGDPIISGVPNMRTINLIKKGWDQMLEKYRDPTTGRLALDERGRALDQVRRSFLNEVDSLNPTYAQARAAYAGPAQVREAVGVGQQAATRGRAADNIDRFNAMTDPQQAGFRTGYADSRIGKIENTPGVGSNKVAPLTSQKAQAELGALSLHQGPVQPGRVAPMQQRLNNEQTMFETRARALGGSKTAENLADDQALAINPHMLGLAHNVITGNWGAAMHNAISAGHTFATGNTAPVRAALGRMLLDTGVQPHHLTRAINATIQRMQYIQNLSRTANRVTSGALTPAITAPAPQPSN